MLPISHTHPDHIGNVELFPQAMLLVQKAEYDWPNPLGVGRFKPEHPVTKLEGDHDVFGDGSVTIIATPGHTPGHQSLLVKLAKTGAVLDDEGLHRMIGDRRGAVSNFHRQIIVDERIVDGRDNKANWVSITATTTARRWRRRERGHHASGMTSADRLGSANAARHFEAIAMVPPV